MDCATSTTHGALDLFRLTEDQAVSLVEQAETPELARILQDLHWAIRLDNAAEHVKAVGRITDLVMASTGGAE